MNQARDELHAHYDAMWDDAIGALANGDIDCDTCLGAGPDSRRGLTLLARPCRMLRERFDALLDRLTAAEPQQYRYPPSDMHVTILPLFTATDSPAIELARLEDYRAAVNAALDGIDSFEIDFDGIALSRGAVVARGFPRGAALETLRQRLRDQLRERGLGASLDQRYRLVTAHATLFRFMTPLRRPADFAALLEGLRHEPFGVTRVDQVELVINDWYMSITSLQRVATVPLESSSA